jgi:hypothetical protein
MSKRDSDPVVSASSTHDFITILLNAVQGVQYKLFALVFVLFIFLSSDVFTTRVLSKFGSATDGHNVTSWGTVVIGTMLVFGMIALDMLIKIDVV